jgi:hypothetical protein
MRGRDGVVKYVIDKLQRALVDAIEGYGVGAKYSISLEVEIKERVHPYKMSDGKTRPLNIKRVGASDE